MTARRISLLLTLAVLAGVVWLAWWTSDWVRRAATEPVGGLYFPRRMEMYVPQFFQNDPRWAADALGPTQGTMGAEGCAVAAASMALASYGIDVDPGRLNKFLTKLPGGYTSQGWIYWEKAAEFDPAFTAKLLPHYEDLPSHFLIDWNLLNNNPVIARLRYPEGVTHFVVICGKQ